MLLLLNVALGARILGMFPMPVKSHSIMHTSYMEELAARGHQVVMFSPFSLQKQMGNFTDIHLRVTLPELMNQFGKFDFFFN